MSKVPKLKFPSTASKKTSTPLISKDSLPLYGPNIDPHTTQPLVSDSRLTPIPKHKLSSHDLGLDKKNTHVDTNLLLDHLKNLGSLEEEAVLRIIQLAAQVFQNEPTLLNIDAPVTIFGDIHGQFYDLIRLFDRAGYPKLSGDSKYLLLGDYVDRGKFSVEVLLVLYSFKINYPNSIYLLRGNHESRRLVQYFSFETECLAKYSPLVFDKFCTSFDYLPLGCIVNTSSGKFLCVHAGIGPDINTVHSFISLILSWRISHPSKEVLISQMKVVFVISCGQTPFQIKSYLLLESVISVWLIFVRIQLVVVVFNMGTLL